MLKSKFVRNTTALVALVLSTTPIVIYFSLNRFPLCKIDSSDSSKSFGESSPNHSIPFDFNYGHKNLQTSTFDMKSELEQRLHEVDAKFQSDNFPKNLHEIIANLDILNDYSSQGNAEVLWRLGKAYYHLADTENSLSHSEKGIKYCEAALESEKKNYNVHKWYAKALTWDINNMSLRDQIKYGNMYKQHTEEALRLNQQDSTLHFMLGEYYYKLAEVPAYQISIGRFFFSNLPTGTYADALQSLIKAYKLNPNLKHVCLFLGKTYVRQNNLTEARALLSHAEKLLRTKTFEDRFDDYHFIQSEIDNEIISLFKKYC